MTTLHNRSSPTMVPDVEKGQTQHMNVNGNGSIADTHVEHPHNGHAHQKQWGNTSLLDSANGYQGSGGYVNRAVTPGGHPADSSQPAFPVFHRKLGNPAPLGLLAFGLTTFVLSMYNARIRNVTEPNVILGLALGFGGLGQIIAGIEEFCTGNTFGATAFVSYGGFWFSFGCLYIPQFEILSAYGNNTAELDSALGLYLIAWGCITFIFLLATFKSSIALAGVFFFLDITFWLLAAGFLAPSPKSTQAGGIFGIITAAFAAYTALAGLLTPDTSYFRLPVGRLNKDN